MIHQTVKKWADELNKVIEENEIDFTPLIIKKHEIKKSSRR